MTFLRTLLYRTFKLSRKVAKTRYIAVMLSISVVLSIWLTYDTIKDSNESNLFGPDPSYAIGLILVDVLLLMALVALVARRLIKLFIERRKGVVGSRLQTRIVVMFSIVALIPTIFMTVFAALFFNLGIQAWFDKKVNVAIEGSVTIAQSYLEDHKKIIRADILGIANDLSRNASILRRNNTLFNQAVNELAGGSLSEVIVFSRERIIARSRELFLESDMPSEEDLRRADLGETVILSDEEMHRVRALVRLDNFFDAYLLVGRFVDADILNYIELTQGAAHQYRQMKDNISILQIKFFAVFLIVSILLVLLVVLFGMIFAVDLVKPVSHLLFATEKVKLGDLTVRVPEGHENDEVDALGRAFNRMTKQLQQQRNDLASAQRWIAWSDVARRIAHEIKNPLTPIQLASERLRRKFSKQVEDKELYEKYLTTIINNVADIGKMVEEFANFARLPAPEFKDYNICKLVKEIIFSRDAISPHIKVEAHIGLETLILNGDESQMNRVLTNLLKNAEESIEESRKETQQPEQGLIVVELQQIDNLCQIKIMDNGKGFNEMMMDRLTEPYVTTKSKGTGLGLAIVKKIVEDHNGTISFSNLDNGACVKVELCVNH